MPSEIYLKLITQRSIFELPRGVVGFALRARPALWQTFKDRLFLAIQFSKTDKIAFAPVDIRIHRAAESKLSKSLVSRLHRSAKARLR